ncbi:pyridoxal kinase PdxY [Nitratireductor thuwali]|uniref:pyridoxal kinase n=1 Tax=Nitratireductor thuwali TaxID=2267699 RepID=A0ABY5MNL1_9HYPH|nr:Pyridoxal kinase PdxY [Nitratireductor thuwali]
MMDGKAVIVISSHVARGAVGNRTIVFALESCGHPVWAVPTIALPWHPGHGPATRIVPPAEEFSAFMGDLERAPWLGQVGAVTSGYLGEASQADAVVSLVAAVKKANPRAFYVCDPVMGDAEGQYVAESTAAAVRDRLMPIADLATPNRFELSWMTGRKLDSIAAIRAAASDAKPPAMLVTSAPGEAAGSIGNLLMSAGSALLAEHPAVDNPPKGTGDLVAALYVSRLLKGDGAEDALRYATSGVFQAVERACARGADELTLAADIDCMIRPATQVTLRRLQAGIAAAG